jgi:glycosyltransferase involved in cell wall biosynthesis
VNLAIIIPALNEAGSIGAVIHRIPAGLAQQIIVVDNGSRDGTAAVATHAGAQVVPEPRRGYGQACLTGLAHLRDEIDTIAILDADGSDDPQLLLKLLAKPDADFIVSARTLGLAKENLSPQQRFGNWLACFLIRWLWRYDYRDLGPLRVIRRDALERLEMCDTTWGWNVEMQIKAIERSLRIRQVDVPYGHRIAGQSKISGTITGTVRAGWKILVTIAKLRFLSFGGAGVPACEASPAQAETPAPPQSF